jgi:hypothetical protein
MNISKSVQDFDGTLVNSTTICPRLKVDLG